MRVAHLTSVHPAFDVRIFHKECKTLAAAGYEVVLVVPHERDEMVDGVRIRAVPRPRNRWQRVTNTIWQMYRIALLENAEIYHFHDPELLPLALLLKLRGKRTVYDVHEDAPQQVLSKHWIPPYLRPLVSRAVFALEAVAARQLDGIVTATETITERFERTNSCTVTLHNWPLEREFDGFMATPFATDRSKVRVGYFGAIGELRGATVMLDAVFRLNQSIPAVLVLAGRFAPEGYKEVLEHHPGWRHTEYLGILDRDQVLEQLTCLDVGVHVLAPLPRYVVALPTKMFEFMAAGLPYVTAHFPMLRRIADEYGCGLVIDPTNVQEVVDAVLWLVRHQDEARAMGKRGRKAALTDFCWEDEAKKLVTLYESILTGT